MKLNWVLLLITFNLTSLWGMDLPLRKEKPISLLLGKWEFRDHSGHYTHTRNIKQNCNLSFWKDGNIHFNDCPHTVTVTFDGNQYRFSVQSDQTKLDSKLVFHFKKEQDELFYGGGTQYSHLSLNNHKIEFLSQEQGNGRGIQPLTFFQELIRPGLSGSTTTTYAASPIVVSSKKYALIVDSYQYGKADFTNEKSFHLSFFGPKVKLYYFKEKNWKQLFYQTSTVTGRMRSLPHWIQQGALVGLMGGKKKVDEKLQKIKNAGTPIAGVWLQDWVGRRDTFLGTRLKWDWQLEKKSYPNLQFGYPFLGYFNPYLTKLPENDERKSLLTEAKKQNYLVKNENRFYHSFQGGFHAYLVDLHNPKAYGWLKDHMKKEISQHHFKGWMADFSENYPIFDHGHDHHLYIEKWMQLNREIVNELGPNELTFFNRASHLKVPGLSTLFWLGDQTSTWDRKDGLHSSLIGLLTSSMSGKVYSHSDIGGYVSLKFSPLIDIIRDEELLIRWMELNAFTPIFRTHLGLNPELAIQVYQNEKVLSSFARWSRIYKSLYEYKKPYVKLASTHGGPLISPLFLNYPQDKNTYLIDDQFLLGNDLLVAPILSPGSNKREVYLPSGHWTHLWSGRVFLSRGQSFSIKAPLGQPPVFVTNEFPRELIKEIKSF